MCPLVTTVALYGRVMSPETLSLITLMAFGIRDMGSWPWDPTLGSPKVACSLGTKYCCCNSSHGCHLFGKVLRKKRQHILL